MPSQSEAAANDPNDAVRTDPSTADVGPTEAEIETWAQQEHERREAWLRGPTEAQKSDWAEREHTRRMAEGGLRSAASRLAPGENPMFVMQRYAREAQLAAEGAMSLVFNLSVRDVFDQLVQAGREWEDEYTSRPVRRRIALDETRHQPGASQSEGGAKGTDHAPGTATPTN
jgi:hypothetical protein